MGLGGISIWQLLIVLLIVALIFGTKKLRGIGGDLGGAVKGFKKAINEDADDKSEDADDKSEDAKSETEQAESSKTEEK